MFLWVDAPELCFTEHGDLIIHQYVITSWGSNGFMAQSMRSMAQSMRFKSYVVSTERLGNWRQPQTGDNRKLETTVNYEISVIYSIR